MELNIYVHSDFVETKNFKSINVLTKEIGKIFLQEYNKSFSSDITVKAFSKDEERCVAKFSFVKRGSVLVETNEGFVEMPSMHCGTHTLDVDYLVSNGLRHDAYSYKELRYINPLKNNYKKYIIEATKKNSDTLSARYGSIDIPRDECREVIYPAYMHNILFYEKLSKGYKDYSSVFKGDAFEEKNVEIKGPSNSDNHVSDELYNLLLAYSKSLIKNIFVSNKVTEKQALKSRELFEKLKKQKTVEKFNNVLADLIILSPRKRDPFCGDKIGRFFANSTTDFEHILDFEESLVIALETILSNDQKAKAARAAKKNSNLQVEEKGILSIFDKMGIQIYKANDEQRQEVLDHLSCSYKNRVKEIYRVKPLAQEKAFNEYCQKHNISKIKQLWHGSVNSNWLSIVEKGLKITASPSNGRMFGDGLYFANSCDKSFGYTSYYGSRWANGNSQEAIMGLYATAYGNPCFTKSYGQNFSESRLRAMNCDCVHATSANTGLRSDEIIFYSEKAVVLNYIVIFN